MSCNSLHCYLSLFIQVQNKVFPSRGQFGADLGCSPRPPPPPMGVSRVGRRPRKDRPHGLVSPNLYNSLLFRPRVSNRIGRGQCVTWYIWGLLNRGRDGGGQRTAGVGGGTTCRPGGGGGGGGGGGWRGI